MLTSKVNLKDEDSIDKFLDAFQKSKFDFKTVIGKQFINGLKKKSIESYSNHDFYKSNDWNENHVENKIYKELSKSISSTSTKNYQNYYTTNKINKVSPVINFLPMLYMILLLLFPAQVGMLVLGIALIFCLVALGEYLKFNKYTIILLIISMCIPPLGILLTIIGLIRKGKYITRYSKMIQSGFIFYLGTAFVVNQLFNIRYDNYGMPGITDLIYQWKFMNNNIGGAEIFVLIIQFVFFVGYISFSIRLSVQFKKILKENQIRGINTKKTLVFILKTPFTTLLMFLPCILGSISDDFFDNIFNDESMDIDNQDHYVDSHIRHMPDGKDVNVRGYYRMNPDDIVENNYSYKGK